MLSSFRRSRARYRLVAATCAVLLGSTASAAQADPNGPPERCPLGFSAQTLEEVLVRYGGSFTEEEIRAAFAGHDSNANGIICGKPVSRFDKAFPLQIIRDDLAKP